MKIRTGFVTNSSSYSSAVIRIQSRKLASLLKEYEELFMKIYDDGSIDKSVLFHDAYVRGWTFYVVQDEVADYWADTPTELNSVLDCLINGLGYYHRTENQESERKQKELLKELKAQKQKLTDSIQKVSWEFQDDSDGEFEVDGARVRTFTYDRENGGDGTYEESDRDNFAEFDFDEDE
jgi:hypothetical protein